MKSGMLEQAVYRQLMAAYMLLIDFLPQQIRNNVPRNSISGLNSPNYKFRVDYIPKLYFDNTKPRIGNSGYIINPSLMIQSKAFLFILFLFASLIAGAQSISWTQVA